VTTKDACLLNVAANALPRLLYFDHLKIFTVLPDDVSTCLSLFDLMMNALGELQDYLFENGFANKVPDFLQLRIEKYVFILDSFELILKTLQAKFFEVEKNLLDCNREGLGVGQDCFY
jgi:hypothetical protein